VKRLILARHAESELNVSGLLNGDASVAVALTERGREQARALGRDAGAVDVAVHTRFERTRATAELAWPTAPRVAVRDLNEISYGRFEGTAWSDGYHDWCRTTGPLEPSPGGGESRADAMRRYVRGYRTLLERPEETVALVAHGMHVAYVLLALAGQPPIPVLPGIPPAVPIIVGRDRFGEAVELIEAWVREPAWA
jgi:broad specificity phosphatase PhoE